jgi:hypothetical protein
VITRKLLRLIPVALLLCLLVALPAAAAQPEAPPRAPSVYDQLTSLPLPEAPRPGEATLPPAGDTAAPLAGDYVGEWSRWAISGYGNDDLGWEIFAADSGLHLQVRLASSLASEIHPKADRGFRRVVFASNRDGDFELFSIAADGSDLRQLTFNTTDDAWPMWSPNGQRIAFTAYRDGQPEIYVMNADGSEQKRLTNSPATDAMPDWSPEGDQIAFASYRDGAHGIFVMDADGTDQRRVTSAVYAQRPKWSPDGKQIAFDADGDGDTWQDLFLMDVNGGNVRMIYDGQSLSEIMLGSWSPDNDYLAFTDVSYIEYQGQFYWTEAWTYRLYLETNYTTRLMTGDTLWNGQWQTTDGDPPQVRLTPLAAMTSARGVLLDWSGEDVGAAGMLDYLVQVREPSGQWRTFMERPYNWPFALYSNAAPGTTGAFRIRARDQAFNISPASAAAQTETFFYSALLAARATDNRGAPLQEARFVRLPDGGDATTGRDGWAVLPLTRWGFQSVELFHEYKSLPADNRVARPGASYEPYLPVGNVLSNSALDAGLAGWTAAGSNPPVASADPFRGAGSVRLGAACAAPCLAPVVSLGQPELTVHDAVADNRGNVHVVWEGRFTGPNGPVRATYSMRAADGTWTAAESLDPGHDTYPVVITTDLAGGLHALWKRSDSGDTRLVYRYRPANGAWQPVSPLLNTGNLAAPNYLGSDSRGNLFAVGWELQNGSEPYVIGKLTGGAWGGAEKLSYRLNIHVNPVAADIGPDDRLTILGWASVSPNEAATVLLTRTAEGQWGMEAGLPFDVYEYVYYFDLSRDGATYVIDGSWGEPTYLYRRAPAGDWSEAMALPINPYSVDGAVDGTGRLHLLGGEGSYVTWTPGSGWQSPAPVDATEGQLVLDAFDLPHLIGQPAYPADNEVLYIGPALTTAAGSSTLWQQVTIPANMSAPTLAFMQRRHGERPGGQTALRATVDDAGALTPLNVTSGGPAWSLGWVDLSAWKGKTVKVGFTLTQAAGEPAARAWLDDITLSPGHADMVLVATAPRSVGKGKPAMVTIEVGNQGGVAAAGATLRVELEDELTYISATPAPATVNGHTLTWTLGTLPAFSTPSTVVVTVRGQTNPMGLTSPYYINVAAETTTAEQQFDNNDRIVELIIAEQQFLPTIR